MAIENQELMHKLVRAGMIMRHIDGEPGGRCPHGHGGGGREGRGAQAHMGDAQFRIGPHDERPHGPHAEGPQGPARGERGPHGSRRRGQMRVISMIAVKEGITQKDLAYLLGIRPQTLGEMLHKLEERGLVERRKSETDGRAIEVYLTDEGRMLAEQIDERRKLVAADVFAVLTEEEKEQLSSILDKLAAELDEHRPRRRGHKGAHGEAACGPGQPA